MSDKPVLSYRAVEPLAPEVRQLRWLVLAHYITAGILAIQFPAIYLASTLFIVGLKRTMPFLLDHLRADERLMFQMLIWLGFGLMSAVSGWMISRRRFLITSQLIAVVMCFLVPVATATGIAALILLIRPGVRKLYRNCKASGMIQSS